MTEEQIPNKEDVKATPKEQIIEGVILASKVTTWRDTLTPEQLTKFDEADRDKKIVRVDYETIPDQIRGHCNYTWYKEPTDRSKLGKALNKYESLAPGTKIKIFFNEEGFSEILLK